MHDCRLAALPFQDALWRLRAYLRLRRAPDCVFAAVSLAYWRTSTTPPTEAQVAEATANLESAALPSAGCCDLLRPFLQADCPCTRCVAATLACSAHPRCWQASSPHAASAACSPCLQRLPARTHASRVPPRRWDGHFRHHGAGVRPELCGLLPLGPGSRAPAACDGSADLDEFN